MAKKGRCKQCGGKYELKKDGTIRVHTSASGICRGSNKKPVGK